MLWDQLGSLPCLASLLATIPSCVSLTHNRDNIKNGVEAPVESAQHLGNTRTEETGQYRPTPPSEPCSLLASRGSEGPWALGSRRFCWFSRAPHEATEGAGQG